MLQNDSKSSRAAEKLQNRHCEERFLRRGNLEFIDFFKTEIAKFIPNVNNEIASLRSQRRPKDFFSDLIEQYCPLGSAEGLDSE